MTVRHESLTDEQVGALRTGYTLKHALDERDKARKERDELLAACEAVANWYGLDGDGIDEPVRSQVLAAIDKAKGK